MKAKLFKWTTVLLLLGALVSVWCIYSFWLGSTSWYLKQREQRARKEFEEIKYKAERGELDPERELGILYFSGSKSGPVIQQNREEAEKWFKRAASHGDRTANGYL